MVNNSGYSGAPLEKKLGYKTGITARLIQQPSHYFDYFTHLPGGIVFLEDDREPKDLIHYFAKHHEELVSKLPGLKREITQNGCIWVSWQKKASKVPTDITEDRIRECASKTGLVDVKVCMVDQTWSALKLVIPKKDRK